MNKKIAFLLSFILSLHYLPTLQSQEIMQQSYWDPQKKALAQLKIEIAEQIYNISTQMKDLAAENQQLYEQLRQPKRTVGLGTLIGTTLLGTIAAGPSLTLNYINPYVTPTQYQQTVNKASLGIAGTIAALSALYLTKRTTQATYDFFMHDSNMQSIRTEIEKVNNEIRRLQENIQRKIANFPRNPIVELSLPEVVACGKLERIYQQNNSISLDQINSFLNDHKPLTKKDILNILELRKADLIFQKYRGEASGSGFSNFFSGNNLAGDVVNAIILVPWFILGALFQGAMEVAKENNIDEEIILLTEMIRKVRTIV